MPSKVDKAILLNFLRRRRLKAPRRSAQVNQRGIKELLTRWTSRIIQLKKNDYMHLPSLMRTANGFSKYRRCTYCVYDCWLRSKLLCNWPSIVGITKIGGRSGIIWILIFMIPVVLPQWFIIPSRIQIYDSRRLLITYWLENWTLGTAISCIPWIERN